MLQKRCNVTTMLLFDFGYRSVVVRNVTLLPTFEKMRGDIFIYVFVLGDNLPECPEINAIYIFS